YLAMAAYNSGPVRVQRALDRTGADNFWTLAEKRALPKETINYVPNILALTIIGKNPEKYGFNVTPEAPLETERVQVDKATDLRVIAEAINLPVEDLLQLNSHVLRWTTPPDDIDFQLILPKGYAEKFNEQVASLPANKRILFREHVVKKGDTLGFIARKYGATVPQLVQANNLGKTPVLRVGRSLIIPMSGVTPPPSAGAVYDRPDAHRAPLQSPKGQPVSAARATSYTVRPGDTLSKIAAHFNITVDQVKSWNHLTSSRLVVGKRLVVGHQPAQAASTRASSGSTGAKAKKVIHQVRQGETLDKIATTYKTSVDAILSWNESENLSVIHPGDRITIFLGDTN
ncbi:MAG TPA: LysM peptidoglycan-binding domain-containing protein, partial [Terriglobia bacterium]|nr:LysM peptidoglycan-binding domain-containing protein [Terriglobia bacterium]